MREPADNERKYMALGELVRELRGSFHSQDWLASLLGVSPKLISQVENGFKRFSPYRLCLLAVVFKLDLANLAEKAGYSEFDLIEKYNPAYLMQTDFSNFLWQSQVMFKTSQQTREFGEPELAKSQLFFTIENMEKRISLEADNLKDLLDIKFLLIRNYAERMACDNDISLRGETVKAVMPDFAKLMTLAVISKDNHGMALAHSWLAGAYFVDGDHQKAKENADRAVPFFNEDPMMLAETLRGLMIDHALLKDKQGFDLYKFKALEAVENGLIKTPMDIAVIREGIGHSKTVFGQMDAIEDLQAAEREMSKVNALKKPRPVEYLRIYRSVLNYFQRMKDLGKKINYQIYDEYVQKAFRSSTALKDYPRHRKEIEEIIKEFPTYHLNKSAGVKQLGLF